MQKVCSDFNHQEQLVVVLGMHRSGTSVVARGLRAVGVSLGDRLMPPAIGNNDNGFWEDLDVVEFNEKLLGACGHVWHSVRPLLEVDIQFLCEQGYLKEAIRLLRNKLSSNSRFGFKDPRVAKLLPFWLRVFQVGRFNVRFVLAIRNPLSVVDSLAKRDGFSLEKSYLLWATHVLTILAGISGHSCIVFDYDDVIEAPTLFLDRLSEFLGYEAEENDRAIFLNEFLVTNLRHSRYLSTDIHADVAAIDLVKDIYATLKDISERELHIGEALAQHQVSQWNQEWIRMRPAFALIDQLYSTSSKNDGQIVSLKSVLTDREQQIADLKISISEFEVQIENIRQIVLKHEKEGEYLQRLLREREVEVGSLNHTIAEATGKLASLGNAVAERDAKIIEINQSLSESEGQYLKLTHTNMEMERAMADVKNTAIAQETQIKAHQETISAIYQSRSWRITKFMRRIGIFRLKFRDVLAVVYRFFQRESVYVLLKKSLRIWWCEGWEGLKLRIRREHSLSILVETEIRGVQPVTPRFEVIPAAIVQDIEGSFSLAPTPQGYTYIQPQFPPDFEAKIGGLRCTPLFSIVVPVYNTSIKLLDAVIASVKSQWYPHWQLILADDASTAEDTRRTLTTINHPKIKVLRLESNQGISGATNFALSVADGDFIVFLDHDDELTVDCLYELALCIDREQPDFIYSDEDKLAENGKYIEPHFKPDWSPDTMMSTMFTCHVACVRRSLVQKVGGLRSEYDGCQDWDFVLRVSEQTDRICHIPKILYHWRIIPASIASDIAAKPYVLEASRRVRESAVARRGLAAVIEPLPQMVGYFRVAYKLQGEPLISIIIPTRDNERILRRCVDSILNRTTYRKFELVILDNGSIDSSAVMYLQQLRETEGVTVIRHDAPFNFSELNNIGARASSGELLLFLNDDTEVLQEDWLERMGGFAQLRHIGAVGAKLLYPELQKVQHSGVLNLEDGPGHAFLLQDADSPGYFMRNLLEYNWLAVTGACLMISRDKFNGLDGFCESLPVAYNDIDLCMRLRDSGFYNVVCQAVRLVHHESVSRGVDHIDPAKMARLEREKAHLYERNYKYFQYDPFYNLNLHPNGINFEVAA